MIGLALMIGLVLMLAGWAGYCNEKTFRDRLILVDDANVEFDRLISEKKYGEVMRPFDKLRDTSYEKHFLYRFTFRDPRKLYG